MNQAYSGTARGVRDYLDPSAPFLLYFDDFIERQSHDHILGGGRPNAQIDFICRKRQFPTSLRTGMGFIRRQVIYRVRSIMR